MRFSVLTFMLTFIFICLLCTLLGIVLALFKYILGMSALASLIAFLFIFSGISAISFRPNRN